MFLAESYHEALTTLGISTEAFDAAFETATAKEAVSADFARARTLGVSSFPTILVEKDGRYSVVARGYINFE